MKRSEIQKHLEDGNHQLVLDMLADYGPSIWRDTAEIRCLRALGKRDEVLRLAEQLARESNLIGDIERNDRARHIALVLTEQGRAKRACEIMAELCENNPNIPALMREYAFALAADSRLDGAEYYLRKTLALRPDSASTHAQLARVYCRSGRVDKGVRSYYRAASLNPENTSYLQRLTYWTNFLDETTQQSNYQLARLWESKSATRRANSQAAWRSSNPDKILKLGFVASDLCGHATSFFFLPFLKGIDRRAFSITAYDNTRKTGKRGNEVKALCDSWQNTAKLSDVELTAQIYADEIDVLIDLDGHSGKNRLGVFAKQAAPIQIAWLGYPASTGLDTIQYRISDLIVDPKGVNNNYFSEQSVRLENGFLCYEPFANAPEITSRDVATPICFGSFANLARISGQTLDCWSAALRAVPDSIMFIKRQQLSNTSARDYLIHEFKLRGIAAERLILEYSHSGFEKHLDHYNQVDIVLDTSPYNGTISTLEALWMGKPIVTMTGKTVVSRTSASILHRLDMDDLVCDDVQEFASAASKLATDSKLLNEFRTGLRSRITHSAITNHMQFGQEIGEALRKLWQLRCEEISTNEKNDESVRAST